jgi:hypothetical protein
MIGYIRFGGRYLENLLTTILTANVDSAVFQYSAWLAALRVAHALEAAVVSCADIHNKRPSTLNRTCATYANNSHGYIREAEVELSLLFADVRGSTPLKSLTVEFSKPINCPMGLPAASRRI